MTMLFSVIYTVAFLNTGNGCKQNDSPVGPSGTPDSLALPGWTLVWNDEFSGTRIDAQKWEHEVNGDGGGNNELQYYTSREDNSFIEDGKLVLRARRENYLGKNYTSARMRTRNKGDWLYGRFEVKAKLPYGQGLWPAIWMLPTDWEYGGWPMSGEIDIMECLGHNTWTVYGTIHFHSAQLGRQQSGGSMTLPNGSFAGDFHVFAMEWDSVGFKWFVDGVQFFETVHGQPFDKRFHMLLNVAVGGNWPGSPNEFTTFPQDMVVDYVRVYAKREN
jgi:beta-glucanase (GH16 family)